MDFSRAFSDFLAKAGKSQAGFAREVGVTGPLVNMIIKRKATPPLDRLDAWAAALGLSPDERRTFKMLAGLAHIPDQAVRDLVANQLDSLYAQDLANEQRIADLERTISDLETALKSLHGTRGKL